MHRFAPSVTLSLAVEYFHKDLNDVEVVLGKHVRIPYPEIYNVETQSWEPYKLVVQPTLQKEIDEILIPIDEYGCFLINFVGRRSNPENDEYHTFPVCSVLEYVPLIPISDPQYWPQTQNVANKILMVGIFSTGLAEDDRPTPFGLMHGVEINANALNTILMNNFIYHVPLWVNALAIVFFTLGIAFVSSRISAIWSALISFAAFLILFFTGYI